MLRYIYLIPFVPVLFLLTSLIAGNVEELKELLPNVDLSSPVIDSTPALHFTVRERQVCS